ncbi:30S ribosomal protein S4 [Spirochaeta africana]|uniref:Small ribosomal subunit protein uS4 n=1 Tax=Spirochaeta africana (strain ATCC 700263 / DSM 8902 / Z-7692) TaxID=889378 RepID=H9UJT4_SPIAZ|nr:30S ribosomal protein S4 [Spirochaeta africana]AFG37777.1 ribosomal protein S4, bacterial/organelle type [Spirochaeta africana DSM 8902]
MARNTKAKGKIVRRLGINIYGNQKYDRLLKRKPQGPGNPKRGRIRQTEYGRQLVEKQKLKFAYGLSERQFRNLFEEAKRQKGVAGHNMLILLERRLDNVVYRLGMATSRSQARQLVSHGHIHQNGRKVTIPSALVREGDTISVKDKKSTQDLVRGLLSENASRPVPAWLAIDKDSMVAKVNILPSRDAIPTIADEQLVVEYYAK